MEACCIAVGYLHSILGPDSQVHQHWLLAAAEQGAAPVCVGSLRLCEELLLYGAHTGRFVLFTNSASVLVTLDWSVQGRHT